MTKKIPTIKKMIDDYSKDLQKQFSYVGVSSEDEFYKKQAIIKQNSWHKWDDINSLIISIANLKSAI